MPTNLPKKVAALARAGGLRCSFRTANPRTRRDIWIMGGPCRFPSQRAETTMRLFRPLRRPAAPTAFASSLC
jgi:hypothetical protein